MEKPLKEWFLLRGLAREAEHWGEFPARLQEMVPDCRIHCLDLPGTGTARHALSPWTVAGIVEQLRPRFQALRDPQSTAYLLGLSLGGMVTLEWVERYPQDFAGAVAINTSSRKLSLPFERFSPKAVRFLLRAATATDATQREHAVLRYVSNRQALYEQNARRWAAIHVARPISLQNSARQLAAAAHWRGPSQRPSCPVLLLASRQDRLVNPRCSERLHQQWQLPLEWHPDGGHELTLDDPDWVAARVSAWQARLTPQNR